MRNNSTDLNDVDVCALNSHASAPNKKERLSSTSKARKEANQNKFVKKGGMPDRIKSLEKVDHYKNRPRHGLGFVKPFQSVLKKRLAEGKQKSQEASPSGMDGNDRKCLPGRRKGMQRPGKAKNVPSRGFSISWMGIIKNVIQMEEKKCKDQEITSQCVGENPCLS